MRGWSARSATAPATPALAERKQSMAERRSELEHGSPSDLTLGAGLPRQIGTLQELREFLAARHARVLDLFRQLDLNGDGRISKKEMVLSLGKLGFNTSLDTIAELFATFDVDESGRVDYQELYRFLRTKASRVAIPRTARSAISAGLTTVSGVGVARHAACAAAAPPLAA